MRKELTDTLDQSGPQLVAELDPDHGLFLELMSRGVLTNRQVEKCRVRTFRLHR